MDSSMPASPVGPETAAAAVEVPSAPDQNVQDLMQAAGIDGVPLSEHSSSPRFILEARPSAGLRGVCSVPGDKSISHRAVLFSTLAVGPSRLRGLLEGEDVRSTMRVCRALGAHFEQDTSQDHTRDWICHGAGLGSLKEPDTVLDCGNAGTLARLLIGLLAANPIRACLTGDASLSRRPMGRMAHLVRETGASFKFRADDFLPAFIEGRLPWTPLRAVLKTGSAQLKSGFLLAALHAPGQSELLEHTPSRDHSERMLPLFGVELQTDALPEQNGYRLRLTGQQELQACDLVSIPGDFSSAAFVLVAGLIVPDSKITIENVGLNPTRTGLLRALRAMGARLDVTPNSTTGGEPLGTLCAETSTLHGIELDGSEVPFTIDEYPVLCCAASLARGASRFTGLAELRAKESDRLAAVAEGLRKLGVPVETGPDWIAIEGQNGRLPDFQDPVELDSQLDHRLAMSFLVLGLAMRRGGVRLDATPVSTSFPGFLELFQKLGGTMRSVV